jgi:hypothetical protein
MEACYILIDPELHIEARQVPDLSAVMIDDGPTREPSDDLRMTALRYLST